MIPDCGRGRLVKRGSKKTLLEGYRLEYMSMQLFGRYNRAGSGIGSKSLRWRFASFKEAPIVYAAVKKLMADQIQPPKNGRNEFHGPNTDTAIDLSSTGLLH